MLRADRAPAALPNDKTLDKSGTGDKSKSNGAAKGAESSGADAAAGSSHGNALLLVHGEDSYYTYDGPVKSSILRQAIKYGVCPPPRAGADSDTYWLRAAASATQSPTGVQKRAVKAEKETSTTTAPTTVGTVAPPATIQTVSVQQTQQPPYRPPQQVVVQQQDRQFSPMEGEPVYAGYGSPMDYGQVSTFTATSGTLPRRQSVDRQQQMQQQQQQMEMMDQQGYGTLHSQRQSQPPMYGVRYDGQMPAYASIHKRGASEMQESYNRTAQPPPPAMMYHHQQASYTSLPIESQGHYARPAMPPQARVIQPSQQQGQPAYGPPPMNMGPAYYDDPSPPMMYGTLPAQTGSGYHHVPPTFYPGGTSGRPQHPPPGGQCPGLPPQQVPSYAQQQQQAAALRSPVVSTTATVSTSDDQGVGSAPRSGQSSADHTPVVARRGADGIDSAASEVTLTGQPHSPPRQYYGSPPLATSDLGASYQQTPSGTLQSRASSQAVTGVGAPVPPPKPVLSASQVSLGANRARTSLTVLASSQHKLPTGAKIDKDADAGSSANFSLASTHSAHVAAGGGGRGSSHLATGAHLSTSCL